MDVMKASVLRAPAAVATNPLAWMDVPRPDPAPGQVLVRVHACGVCRTDLHIVEGELPPRKSPVVPGHQIVGVVAQAGSEAKRFRSGDRVGIAWLHHTCGVCEYCRAGKENLCDRADFTGYTVDGGYAQYALAEEAFAYPIPDGFADIAAAPLLCAGIIGYRCLRLSGIETGGRLGLYGFGAAAHVAIQVARYWGVEVFAFTRDLRHRQLAMELGAVWAGNSSDAPPQELDAAIVFAPAGELVIDGLRALKKGGTLALGGIHMSAIPPIDYQWLYHERVIRSVANNTRQDGKEFLQLAATIPIHTETQQFPMSEANAALKALKNDAIRGAAVLTAD